MIASRIPPLSAPTLTRRRFVRDVAATGALSLPPWPLPFVGPRRLGGGTQGAAGACGKRARSLSGCRLNDPGLLGEARRRRRERQIQVQATSSCGKRGTDVRIGDRPAAAG
jgi:hypothetical protein